MRTIRWVLLLAVAGWSVVGFAQQSDKTLPRWSIGPFTRPLDAPLIRPNPEALFTDPLLLRPVHWEALNTFNPAAIVRDGKVYVLYRAEDNSGTMQIGMHTSRLGLAVSSDGLHFQPMAEPVFYPAKDDQQAREWPGGVEDPRVVEAPDGGYVLTYTQWNRKTYTIGVATSRDLIHWTKHGPALGETGLGENGPYAHLMYKSGGIVTRPHRGRLVAARIGGRYWMYWGEIEIRLAWSRDLIHWTPVETAPGHPLVLLHDRAGRFDSGFPEVGPPPILTAKGILLVYNGKNADGKYGTASQNRDNHLDPGAYAVGEALFDARAPEKLLGRLDEPVLRPERPYERSGQYAAGTTFAEGLVLFHHRWFLYYGCADSFVAVATAAR